MNRSKNPNSPSIFFQAANHALKSMQGNVLVYLIVLILIFGVLGVTIISLFTTATSSSATPNNARRAAYVTESAMRYALSELRNSGFDTGVVDSLNTTTYTVNSTGSFSLNIFAPWFVATDNYNFGGGGGTLTLNVPVGKLTAGWMAKDLANVWVVNYDYLNINRTTARDGVASWAMINDSTLTVTVNGDIIVNQGERICFMVKPYGDPAAFGDDGDLEVRIQAKDFFPQSDGVININGFDYVYKKLIVGADRVTLKNISASDMPNKETPPSSLDLSADDFIVLSPRNYIVIPTATADTVSVAGTLDQAVNIYDSATVKPITRSPDISLNQYDLVNDLNSPDTPGFITVDNDADAKTIDIGSNLEGQTDFGGIWFDTDATIGGKADVCSSAGACEFGRGVRVFFTLDYSGTADGLTFALINATHNTTSSIGGDIEAGELLGYAGDSRKVASPTAATDFLDAIGAAQDPPDPGLHPPKIALEFDTYNNSKNYVYCDGNNIVNGNRNDPFSVEIQQDALQFVFWGHTSLLMPCRNYTIGSTDVEDHPTYDDNRHDAEAPEVKWIYDDDIWNNVRSTPALSYDGSTVYVGSEDNYFYAVYTADGTTKWWFGTGGDVHSSPIVGPDGMVYVGSHGEAGPGRVYAFDPEARLLQPQPSGGTLNTSAYKEWVFYTPNNVNSSPAIGADGKIYIGDDNGNFYALNPVDRWAASEVDTDPKEDTLTANEWKFTHAGFNDASKGYPAIGPALDVDPTGNRQRIYITSRDPSDNTLFALNPADGSIEWTFGTGDSSEFMPAADPNTGIVYTDEMGDEIRALSFDGTTVQTEWVTYIDTDDFTPVVKNGIVYVAGTSGSATGKLTALNATNGNIIWQFDDSGNLGEVRTTPAIAPEGTIYFASKDGLLYAVNPDGTKKWTIPILVDVNDNEGYSSPAVGEDGVVYIGSSSDNNLYAINSFAIPRNIRNLYVTSVIDGTNDTVGGETVTLESEINWLNGHDNAGPWAVRLEVMRSPSQNADLKFEYTLRAWIRQCTIEDTEDCANIVGTFYEDTRIQYSATPHLAQTIELTEAEHLDFSRFIFGFTGATGQDHSQSAVITNFKLSFIRLNDPIAP